MSTEPPTDSPLAGASPGAGTMPWVTRALDLILTTDFKQRRCIRMLLLTALVYAVCIGLMGYGAHVGIFDPVQIGVLAVFCVAFTLLFYVIVRSGRNLRWPDPTLAMPQTLVAQTLIAGAYAVGGEIHPATIILMALVMVFGMFNMRIRSARMVSAYTIVLLGAVIAWRTQVDPEVYVPAHEWMVFVLVATVLPAIAQLSAQLMNMRARLKQQKVALEQALAHINDMAIQDELTGLANRRHMMAQLAEHAQRRTRGGPAFFVAMVDLDHFKQINDKYGHATGDEALRVFAREATSALRATDVIGRWGGEEFLVLLPESAPGEPAGEPTVAVERLRVRLSQLEACPVVPELRIAFSAGFSRHRDGEAVDHTIERADRALYAAKLAGRNRSVVD
ncbi:MAG: diguanylate cyclase [Pseudomonadota bacterium]